ncbi:hypothetical protein OQA88_2713 [Cercophora sp. LCS_1]
MLRGWAPAPEFFSSVALSAALAILFSVLTRLLESRQSEISSEILCWCILPVLFAIAERSAIHLPVPFSAPTSWQAPSLSLWLIAATLACASLYRAEVGPVELLPVLTPLLMIAEHRMRPDTRLPKQHQAWYTLPSLVTSIWGASVIALIGMTISMGKIPVHWFRVLMLPVPVTALWWAYVGFMRLEDGANGSLAGGTTIPLKQRITNIRLPMRVVVFLLFAFGWQWYVYGSPSPDVILPLASLGLFKALSWYFTAQTAHRSSWCVAPAVATFSLAASRSPYNEALNSQAMLNIGAAFLSLAQVVSILPRKAPCRVGLLFVLLFPLAWYVRNGLDIQASQSRVLTTSTHPAETLIQLANASFARLMETQSQTYSAAEAEYRRRYGIEPPPGFEEWYEFAKENESPIIDEFDTLTNGIKHFFRLSGLEFTHLTRIAFFDSLSDTWSCTFLSENATTHCRHLSLLNDRNYGNSLTTLLKDLPGKIPDMTFLVNQLDEPRVLIPPTDQEDHAKQRYRIKKLSGKATLPTLTRFCLQEISRNTNETLVETLGLPFVTNQTAVLDLCQHPEYAEQHGLLAHPPNFRLLTGPVPILSTGALSTMGDILFPSPAYTVEDPFKYDAASDIPWEKKRNYLYWTGSTTGGMATDNSWKQFHRQRFVALAQNLDQTGHVYLQEENEIVQRETSWFLNSRLYDVAFTQIFGCNPEYCRDQFDYFRVKSWAGWNDAIKSRLVFDLDGNGISGRYYKLLASRSAVLKQTLLREWHDDRLVPWVHYIPVSMGMEELPELVRWLASAELGQRRAKEIADQGREWFGKALRPVDRTVYMYRLMLELARLRDPSREATAM